MPAHFCRKGPTESSAPLLKTVDQYAAGVKFAATFCVHTSTVTVGTDDCSSFLHAYGDNGLCHAGEMPVHNQIDRQGGSRLPATHLLLDFGLPTVKLDTLTAYRLVASGKA